MSTTSPITELIRTALNDLQPRLAIHRTNIERLTTELAEENRQHAALLEQDAAYRAALPDEDDEELPDFDQLIENGDV